MTHRLSRPVGFFTLKSFCFEGSRLLVFVAGGCASGDVGFDAAGERSLGFEDVFDGVADGAFASAMVGDDVGLVFDVFTGVGDGEGESTVAHDGKVDDVIADEGGFFRLEMRFLQDLAEGGELVVRSLGDVFDFEIAGAEADGLRDALGDESGFEAAEAGKREAGAVMGVEALDFNRGLAGTGNRDQEKFAVGHDPIDIEQQELYLLCTGLRHGGIVASAGEQFL